MNIQAPSIRPILSAVIGFLGITLTVIAIGLADKMGVIDTFVAKRAIGFSIGLMLVVIGNSLPKLRPLHLRRTKVSSTASERLSGWALVRLDRIVHLRSAESSKVCRSTDWNQRYLDNCTELGVAGAANLLRCSKAERGTGASRDYARRTAENDYLSAVCILLCRHHRMRQVYHR